MKNIKIAVVCDWLVTYAGAERVLEQILTCYPQSDLFSLLDFLPKDGRGFIAGKHTTTSFIQNLPKAKTHYRNYLPLMPLAVEQFDLSKYDLIISSSHAIAKGILVGPDQLHISYVHSPIRYAWDLQHQYLRESNLDHGLKGWLARWILHNVRMWDLRTANGVDRFIANSNFISRRIDKIYRRNAAVIYPPVDVEAFSFQAEKSDFYLTASRMVPYKKMPIIIEAFSAMPDKKLVVIGEGPEFEKCLAVAGPNVQFMGWQPSEVLKLHMQQAKAFIFAAEEDFGITPLEAQSCGTPVIAFGKGAVRETIRGLTHATPTGILFDEQTPAAIVDAVQLFEQEQVLIKAAACRENALRFSSARFRKEFSDLIELELERFTSRKSEGVQ